MNAPNDPDAPEGKIKMFKFPNILKARMGVRFKDQKEGFIAPEAIAEADKIITRLCVDCPTTIEKHLTTLSNIWSKMRDMFDTPERAELSREVFTLAHEIKDVGAMCGFGLTSYFAESLRDYIGHTALNLQAQVVIIQAHLDAMQMAQRQNIKDVDAPEAEELKKMVRKAIDKYK